MFDPEVNFIVGKKQLGKIIDKCIVKHGFTVSAEVLDTIKARGYKFSTRGALTVSIYDMTVPEKKYEPDRRDREGDRQDRAAVQARLPHQ